MSTLHPADSGIESVAAVHALWLVISNLMQPDATEHLMSST